MTLLATSGNFEKFLVNRKGEVVGRWSSVTKPVSAVLIGFVMESAAHELTSHRSLPLTLARPLCCHLLDVTSLDNHGHRCCGVC